MQFFARINNQVEGPFDEATIQSMVTGGTILFDTLLCLDGESNWFPAKDFFPLDPVSGDASSLSRSETTQEEISSLSISEDDGSRLQIRLVSGAELKIKAIRLYDEIVLAEIVAKRSKALKDLQGVSTGLGAIGSVGWVLTASLAIGAIEGALSASAASTAKNLLAEAASLERKLRSESILSLIGIIDNIETPVCRDSLRMSPF